jgi:hypothetical protein
MLKGESQTTKDKGQQREKFDQCKFKRKKINKSAFCFLTNKK